MRKFVTSGLAVLAITGAGLAVSAVPASATTTTVTASTSITGRPDSGGGGTWATDSMTRTLTITSLGGGAYTAAIADSSGRFATIPGAYVPDQAASPGVKFAEWLTGTFSGHASYSFTASETPSASLVPATATGSRPTDTSDWYKLAFPAGTVFGGTGHREQLGLVVCP